MQRSIKNPPYILVILLLAALGLATTTAACTAGKVNAPLPVTPIVTAAQQPLPCAGPGCPNLVIVQSGKLGRYNLSAPGIQAAAPLAQPGEQTLNGRWVIDTGTPAPNGQRVAYTTVGTETGGPVLLHDMASGQWTNLIDALNARQPMDQPALPQEAWWDVIGWLPDNTRLVIGPSDLSLVLVVDLSTFAAQKITFPGGGRGGRLFVGLAPDGSRLTYIGENASGSQVLNAVDLTSGKTSTLLEQPYAQGVLYNPRFSPDQQQVAFLQQKGRPDAGLTYAISLLSTASRQVRVLVDGNLGPTVPVWSPDGSRIAFIRNAGEAPYRVLPGASPQPQASHVWVVSVADGKQTQLTFGDEQARSPVWAKDNNLLAFVTGDGQVQMTSLAQPGTTWQAAGPSLSPELTTVFFLP